MQPLNDANLIRDGLQFKRDLGSPGSALSCYRQGLYVLREFYITKAKSACARNNEGRIAHYMGIVEGIDQSISYPEAMVRKFDELAQVEFARTGPDGE